MCIKSLMLICLFAHANQKHSKKVIPEQRKTVKKSSSKQGYGVYIAVAVVVFGGVFLLMSRGSSDNGSGSANDTRKSDDNLAHDDGLGIGRSVRSDERERPVSSTDHLRDMKPTGTGSDNPFGRTSTSEADRMFEERLETQRLDAKSKKEGILAQHEAMYKQLRRIEEEEKADRVRQQEARRRAELQQAQEEQLRIEEVERMKKAQAEEEKRLERKKQSLAWPNVSDTPMSLQQFKSKLNKTSDKALLESLLALVYEDWLSDLQIWKKSISDEHEEVQSTQQTIDNVLPKQKMNAKIVLHVFDLWKKGTRDITLESLPRDLQNYWKTNSYKATWPKAQEHASIPMEFTVDMRAAVTGFAALGSLRQNDDDVLLSFSDKMYSAVSGTRNSWSAYRRNAIEGDALYELSLLIASTRSIYHLETILKNRNMFTGKPIKQF